MHHTVWTRARSTTNRFVVLLVALIAEREVVHGPLTASEDAQRPVKRLRNHLRYLSVACDNGSGRQRIHHGAFWENHSQRFQAAFVERNGILNESTEHVKNRSHANCLHKRHAVNEGPMELHDIQSLTFGALKLFCCCCDVPVHGPDNNECSHTCEGMPLDSCRMTNQ